MDHILIVPAGTVAQCEQVLAALIDDKLTVLAITPKTSENMASPSMSAVILRGMGLLVLHSGAALVSSALGWGSKDGWSGVACSKTLSSHMRTLADLTKARVILTNRVEAKNCERRSVAAGLTFATPEFISR